MKGIKHQSDYNTVQELTDNVILKTLPYGKWITSDNKEFLFNRDYEPIAGWDVVNEVPILTLPSMWIHKINSNETVMYYGGYIEYPTQDEETFRKCWDILADWSERASKNVRQQ